MTDRTTSAQMDPRGGFRITTALEKLFGPDRTHRPDRLAWSEPQTPPRAAVMFTTVRRPAPRSKDIPSST